MVIEKESFFHMSNDLLCVASLEGFFLELNERWESTLGWSKEELMTKPFIDFVYDEDKARTLKAIERLASGEEVVDFINRYRAKDGQICWLNWSSIKNRNEDLIYAIARDITRERINAQLFEDQRKALAEAEYSYRMMFENSPDAVIHYDSKNTVKLWNRQAEILFGWKAIEVLGKNVSNFIQIGSRAWQCESVDSLLQSSREEKEVVNRGGEVLPLEVTVTPIVIGDHRVFCASIRDLRILRQKEKIIEEQNLRIIESAKMSSLGQMAAGIAHEINNPLSIVHVAARKIKRLLESDKVDIQKTIENVEIVEGTALRIAQIVKGLRHFARDDISDSLAEVSLKSLVDDCFAMCGEKFKNAEVDFRVKYNPERANFLLHCRSVQVMQILLNLLSNSFDAISNLKEKWIEIYAKDDGVMVEVSITDSGRGIPKDVTEKMLNPFFTTKPAGKGTGLGLSIVEEIVKWHSGNLRYVADSKHTKFIFELPKVQKGFKSK